MIKKLRRNIILINMLFVGFVLAAILAVFCVNNYISLRNSTERSLTVASERLNDNKNISAPREIGSKKPFSEPDNMNINSFVVVRVSDDGTVSEIFENNATIDKNIINDVIEKVVAENNFNGEISEYSLMYAVRPEEGGFKAAIADTSFIYSSLLNNIFICLGLLAGGLIIIFIISLGLSYFAVKPVKKAWQQQRQFVADASHELKTPLTVILANNNIMMSHRSSTIAEEQKWLESTDEEAKHMKKLIDQMLFLAKSDAGQTVAEITEVCISDVIEGTVLNFEPVAYENNINIEYSIEPDIIINADKTMLTQLAHILLDNALKYAGDNGHVRIKLNRASDGCRLSINNSGEVIASDDLAHLFDRFYRADKSRAKGGYGLGLSIAYNIVREMKGKIEVESTLEQGTTFTVYLPR